MRRSLLPLTLTILLGLFGGGCSCGGDDADIDGGTNIDASDIDGGETIDAAGNPDAAPVAVETCTDPVPAATSGICDVTTGTGNAILIRGTVLGRHTVFENGSVLVDGSDIVCVGCDCSAAPGFATASRVNCANAAISPALLNPHDHMRFTEGAPVNHGTTRYEHRHDWRGSLSTPQNPNGTGQDSSGMRWGELRMLFGGASSIVGSGRARGLLRNLDDLLSEDEALGFNQIDFETFSLNDSNETFHDNCTWDFKFSETRVAAFPAFLPHIAEGINHYAAEEFRCQSSSFDGGRDYTEKNAAHIHAIGLTAADYYRMVIDDTKLLWSPRSNIDLYGVTAGVTTFANLGGTVALGTDWTYSGSANMQRELACVDYLNKGYYDGYFTDKEIWEMATINNAIAMETQELIGSLAVGKLADITIFAGNAGEHHRAVIESDNADVALVMKNGDLLYGEADTLTSLGESCDAITVCGNARAVCATREFGDSYASIAADTTSSYPAIFCDGPPAGEPTCHPSRPSEYSGVASATDNDGDGIANASDNCPDVFNPIRPIDDGAQPDADSDGLGDPCDPEPLPADLDGDTIPNAQDNCPFDANTNQNDSDEDDKGNVCDPCPNVPNPDSVCPPYATIVDIQMGDIAVGAQVLVTNVVVTSVFSSGVTVQDPSAASPAWSGIYVFTGGSPGVSVGDLVDVEGGVEEYYGNSEIENATITNLGSSGSITPAPLSVANAALEDYEGVLVELTDVASSSAWDCANDNPICADQDLFEVSDGATAKIVVYNKAYEDADWASHVGDTAVTGVMMYRFDRRRIMPRTAADFL